MEVLDGHDLQIRPREGRGRRPRRSSPPDQIIGRRGSPPLDPSTGRIGKTTSTGAATGSVCREDGEGVLNLEDGEGMSGVSSSGSDYQDAVEEGQQT